MQTQWEFEAVPFEFEDEAAAGGNAETAFFLEADEQEWEARPAARLPQRAGFALVRAIPDSPDFRRHVPLDYRLNAKSIVGDLAQDLSRGKAAHFWVELSHFAIAAAEMAEFAGALGIVASGVSIAGPALALILNAMALGAGYQGAAARIAADEAASGFSRGVVMGADRRRASQVKAYFGNRVFPANPQFPRGRATAMANYRLGLLAGYAQGRALSANQRTIFWRDLGRRMGDQSYRGDSKQWRQKQWIDWYVDAAAAFRRHHL